MTPDHLPSMILMWDPNFPFLSTGTSYTWEVPSQVSGRVLVTAQRQGWLSSILLKLAPVVPQVALLLLQEDAVGRGRETSVRKYRGKLSV